MHKNSSSYKGKLILKIHSKIEKLFELIKFSIVGAINTAIDFAVFFVCYSILHLDSSFSQIFGYTAGMINSFLMNKRWTFEDRTKGKKVLIKAFKFGFTNVISLILSIGVIKLSKLYLSSSILIAKILATLCAQGVNYILYKFWVFTKAEADNESI
ncbi:GtrA family protein [Caldicellulosiruptor hydrothermalis 108]|uniref:GtrA family protein n=1 Tax=Caldicellulosiruptor hydrothermalis (strain DSM 18901 / VKM B-2411 / 108) TaxID=632292 RepID=E4Q8B9_CALH1|nr:GtrA family protein [Caldicellulosiruptor hydrothermalis]ADQ07966.1 GtrA family protein [Caldicellulosiruptor hydrothermalis 108]